MRVYLVSVPSRGILFPNPLSEALKTLRLLCVSVPSRGILFPNNVANVQCNAADEACFRPLSGHLISKSIRRRSLNEQKANKRFRPLSGHLISKYCLPEPAILLAFLTLLRGKSFSCIFFLYLTYTIVSKCSIYAVRGKIIFFSNKLLHTTILTHISHICIEI